jgi:tight adherence protein B
VVAQMKKFQLLNKSAIACVLTFVTVTFLTGSIIIAASFAFLAASISFLFLNRKDSKREVALTNAWPEVIDHLISGIQSGLSLSEALSGLGDRGPEILRPYFQSFRAQLMYDGDFNLALNTLKTQFAQHGSDQIFEALMISKSLGGSELLHILRTVGDFLRQDLTLRKEIEVKHSWIRNSAHLSAGAPWVLLLLLCTQPTTAKAFSTPTGVGILATGIFLTAIAYFWMNKLGHLPTTPRVFRNE